MDSGILVVDSNRTCAGIVRDAILSASKKIKVDIAVNKHQLKRRLSNNNYKIVLADISVFLDSDEMLSLLKGTNAQVVSWGVGEQNGNRKPYGQKEIKAFVEQLVQK